MIQSVTRILADVGLVDTKWFTDHARDRGTAVHAATHYYDDGDLDEATLDPEVVPYLEQYKRFRAECVTEMVWMEKRVDVKHSSGHGWHGHPDRLLRINGKQGILDIKCGGPAPWHGIQLAAYASAIDKSYKRWNLYLTPDRYKLVERTDRDDFNVWNATLTVFHWRQKNAA